jgi:DinB superfamily
MSQPTRFWLWKDRRLPGGRHFRVGDTSDTPGMAGSMLKPMTTRVAGFRGEFLWELEIAIRQSVELAEAIPPAKYDWRPDTKARSVSEVFVHVATGNFMLLDVIGVAAPMDFYAQVPAHGQERFSGLIRRNDELAARVREKNAVVPLLKRSLQAVNQSFNQASDPELDRRLHFFGEETTVRRVYLRLLAHAHEHMGQMIAYLRFNGFAPPWSDWRPDRRTQS